MSHGQPARWTRNIALVRGETAATIARPSRLAVTIDIGDISARAPRATTLEAVAIIVRLEHNDFITGPMFKTTSASSIPLFRSPVQCIVVLPHSPRTPFKLAAFVPVQ